MVDEFPNPESEIEITEGEFKRLGDCTADDLEGAVHVAKEKSGLNMKIAAISAAINAGMTAQAMTGVHLDADLRARLDRRDPDEALNELRKLASDLEAASLGLFDDAPKESGP
jgi:hypothetical protein